MATWWDDDTIEQTVTRDFVCSRLIPQEIARLDQPLSFGDNLTDCTYWEWLDGKAKKIFLILTDLGLPDQIFGLIDDSLDDEDLPIPFDLVGRLSLTSSKDEKMERRFYYRQFHYLLRPLQRGVCTDYADDEVVPLDVADKKLAVSPNSHIDKVTLPDHPGMVFCRCQVPISGPGQVSWEDFVSEANGMHGLEHEHLLSYWTSYTHQGHGYVLFTPPPEYSLKSLLATTPSCLKNLDKKTRRQTVMAWIYCLTETVAFLHSLGLPHGSIKPSTVMFTADNRVFFTGFHSSAFSSLLLSGLAGADSTTSFDKEAYDYSAPEHLPRSLSSSPATSLHRSASAGNNTPKLSLTPSSSSHCDPRAADVFALGCVILELLSFLFKKHGRAFATHRGARHKTAGRGGAVLDSSFQRNLGQVDGWMAQLARDAAKKKDDDPVFRGVAPLLKIVEQMLAYCPGERPGAGEVHARVRRVVTEACGMVEPHFVDHNAGWGEDVAAGDFGFGGLSLGGSSPSSPGLVMMMGGGGGGGGGGARGEGLLAGLVRGAGPQQQQMYQQQQYHQQQQQHKRSGSGGSGGSGSSGSGSGIRRMKSMVREATAERERAIPRVRTGFASGQTATRNHHLMRREGQHWQAGLFDGGYYVMNR